MAASSRPTPRTGSAADPSSSKLAVDVHVRLAREDVEDLIRIAEEDCCRVSGVVRRIVITELRRRRRYPEPVPLARAHARDANVQVG